MNVFVYVDESGVFDPKHQDCFVLAGILLFSRDELLNVSRFFLGIEKRIKTQQKLLETDELKAADTPMTERLRLYRSLNPVEKFAVVIKLQDVLEGILASKKNKQRFLDYAIRAGLREKFRDLIYRGKLDPREVEALHVFVDEHTAPTNARYELRELLEQEFELGCFDEHFRAYTPPLFPALRSVKVRFEASHRSVLVRAADIVANRWFFLAREGKLLENKPRQITLTLLPRLQSFFGNVNVEANELEETDHKGR